MAYKTRTNLSKDASHDYAELLNRIHTKVEENERAKWGYP